MILRKFQKYFLHRLVAITWLSIFSQNALAEKIRVAMLQTYGNRPIYSEICEEFTKNFGIEVELVPLKSQIFGAEFDELLKGDFVPDVAYCNGPYQLSNLAEKNLIYPLTNLWEKDSWDENYGKFKKSVSHNDEIYGLPISCNLIGLYFNNVMLAKYGNAPENWEQFIEICEKIKADGVAPIALGLKDKGAIRAWFDYLNLRINGPDFYSKMINGEIEYTDERIVKVFETWKDFSARGFFNENYKEISQTDAFPRLIWGNSVFCLSGGGHFRRYSKSNILTNIDIISFPKINDQPVCEITPLSTFIIPQNAKNRSASKKFIKFLGWPSIVSRFNNQLGYIPPSEKLLNQKGRLASKMCRIVAESDELIQYFDRNLHPSFKGRWLNILVEFDSTGDIEKAVKELERLRKMNYPMM